KRRTQWNRRADHRAIQIDVSQINAPGSEQPIHKKRGAQLFSGHAWKTDSVGNLDQSHVALAFFAGEAELALRADLFSAALASTLARLNTDRNIGLVSLPVFVFCSDG